MKIQEENISTKSMIMLMFVAYLFSFLIRMIWVNQMGGMESFYWNDQLMINTNDGYIWASSSLHELTNSFEYNPRMVDMFQSATVFFTYLAAKGLPLSLDTIILYMPAVISSFVVIPIILITRLYHVTLFGFFAALIGSIAWSYYNRTMIGYYDTDMFSAMAPMFILYFLIASIKEEKLHMALYASLMIFIYPFLYDAGRAIVYGMGLIYIIYMYVFHRKDAFTPKSIILISIGLTPIFYLLKLALIVLAYIIVKRDIIKGKNLLYLSYFSLAVFLLFGNIFGIIWGKVGTYLFRGVEESGLHFYQVKQTVREAGQIPFGTMANRISGSTVGVIASLIGYILLVIKYRPFILALPLIGIGIFSLWGGLRFTVYAVPIAALGAVYLFYVLGSFIANTKVKYAFITLMTALMLYPNVTHIIAYKVPTVLNNKEVKTLQALKEKASPKDYMISWWDYGYPIWYYGGVNTLIDGGKHNHDNFLVSEILSTTSQLEAARLSRIAVETYIASDYKVVADTLFHNKQEDQLDADSYLETLRYGDVSLPAKTVETYLYLPYRMMDIFPTVKIFSNIDLSSGQKKSKPFFYSTSRFKDNGNQIVLGNNIAISKKDGKIQLGRQTVPIKSFYTVTLQNRGKPKVQRQTLSINGGVSVVYLASYNKFLLLDDEMLNSTYIQLFVFENYDTELFELINSDPYSKIYRVKI